MARFSSTVLVPVRLAFCRCVCGSFIDGDYDLVCLPPLSVSACIPTRWSPTVLACFMPISVVACSVSLGHSATEVVVVQVSWRGLVAAKRSSQIPAKKGRSPGE